jgi:RHS repeat-associated protein
LYTATAEIPSVIPDVQSEMNLLVLEGLQKIKGYVYDVAGNRLRKTAENLPVESYFPNQLDQYERVELTPRYHDRMGNFIEDGVWKYTYDYRGQLSSIEKKGTGYRTAFHYDPMGRKIFETRNNQSKLLIYDRWNIIEEYLGPGNIHSSAISDDGVDNVILTSTENNNYWSYTDMLKSVTHILKGEQIYQYFEYDEFGEVLRSTSGGIMVPPFAGKSQIPELEKYDFVFRTYDSKIGRFLQRDPRGYVDGTNLYSYVQNNPASYTDPFGTERDEQISLNDAANIGGGPLSRIEAFFQKSIADVPNIGFRKAISELFDPTYDIEESFQWFLDASEKTVQIWKSTE